MVRSNRLLSFLKSLPIPPAPSLPPLLMAPQGTAEEAVGETTPTAAKAGAMGVQKLLLPPEVTGATFKMPPQAGKATREPHPSSSILIKLVFGAVHQARSLVLYTILGLVATQVWAVEIGDTAATMTKTVSLTLLPPPLQEYLKSAFDWPAGSGSPAGFIFGGGPGSRRGSTAGWHSPHQPNSQFGAFSGSQRDRPDLVAGRFSFHSNGGPSDWSNKPSDQATGPSNPPDWRNPDAAQNTGGKAMNW